MSPILADDRGETARLPGTEVPAEWLGRKTAYPRNSSIDRLFRETAASHPERVALTGGGLSLTYAELDRRSDALAARLTAAGVGRADAVAVAVERSVDQIVAILAVLKAGGAYVPLDPALPDARLAVMLEDTRPRAAVAAPRDAARLAGRGIPVLDPAAVGLAPAAPLPVVTGPGDLAYVMYTSGSTGRPKGVMVEHRAVVRLVRDTDFCTLGPDESFLQFAPLSFDASTLEIWGPLLNGGRLVIAPATASLGDLGRLIAAEQVTSLWLTAGLFHLMVDQHLGELGSLRQLLAGGDVLSAAHVRRALAALPQCRIINGYGPTENTTFTCCHVMRPGDAVPDPVPIGRPIANTRIAILDEALRPVPVGVEGELFAGGDGLARGYLDAPEATAEKFIADPAGAAGERLYRTGDRARWRPDGTVEFLGRIDAQVKISGYRIEPGEIESALGAHPAVARSCVVARVDPAGGKRLVAYVVARDPALRLETLRDFVGKTLPAWMVPALVVGVAALPLNANGKVDRAALPEPFAAPVTPMPEPAARQDGTAAAIEAVWREVLGLAAIDPGRNFFDLGGNSLQLLDAHSRLEARLGRRVPVTALFEFTTLAALARHLDGDGARPEAAALDERAARQRAAFARRPRPKGFAE